MPIFAEVAVQSYVSGDGMNIFDYIIPERYHNIIKTGMKVTVPFGRNRLVEGYIINLKNDTDIETDRLKSIEGVEDCHLFFNEKQVELARWISEEYMCSITDSLKCILPPDVSGKTLKGVVLNISKIQCEKLIEDLKYNKRYKSQVEILELLNKIDGGIAERELIENYSFSKSSINTLIKKSILRSTEIRVLRDPYDGVKFQKYKKPELTSEQKEVIDKILNGEKNGARNFLVHGVTGSGKTEVYMELIEHMIKRGKKAIMLVPEISLTPQTIERFKGRFDRVAVMHSRLSSGERYDEWVRIKEGKVDVVVGARSAVFVPFNNLGIIIVDEEHENSYKSDMTPKYNTIKVAYKRCELENALFVMGSATPSIETYYDALNGKYVICNMNRRVDNRRLPEIEIVDMRDEIMSGNRSIFSRRLYEEINNALKNRNQIILFLNRRGFSTFVSCRKCGHVMKCPRCDVSLTYHMDGNMLNCHYCGYTSKSPDVCPECGSKYIKYFGIGTQKVESEVRKTFPGARVLRMDMDTTSKKGSHEKIYTTFKNKGADILIGTQMISKGLDFPGVAVVGIIAADMTLNIPDFKSCERTFQLITQVSGRAGRGDTYGRVIVQTYSPEHYSLQSALHQDYLEFYNKEILIRHTFMYPPYSELINIIVSSNKEEDAKNMIKSITDKIGTAICKREDVSILGPSPAPISKINTYYRWQTIIKGEVDRDLKKHIKSIITSMHNKGSNFRVSMDINPVSLA